MDKKEKKMNLIIDRFEGTYAVCEKQSNGEMIDIKKGKLPEHAKEGDYLVVEGKSIKIDTEKRKEREARISQLMEELWED